MVPGEQTVRGGLIVRMEKDGHVGWGEAAPPPHMPVDGPALKAEAEAAVEGLNPAALDFIERLDERTPALPIRTGITTALFALRAAQEGLSLGAYLGKGWRKPAARVPINGLVGEAAPEDAVARCKNIWGEGIRTFKIKMHERARIGQPARCRHQRSLSRCQFKARPQRILGPENFLGRLEHMARHRIDYCEEPIPKEFTLADLKRFARLREQSPIPIALDQSVTGPEITRRIIQSGAADALIMKSQAMGGFDRAVEIIRLAESRGILCVMTSSLESAIGLTASLHGAAILPTPLPACGLSLGRFFARDVANKPAIRDGMMTVPTGLGLGMGEISLG